MQLLRAVKYERPTLTMTWSRWPPRLFPATDAEVESATLSDALKCSLGIPPAQSLNAGRAVDSHHANSNAAGFDLSQGVLNKGVAFYLVFDRRCCVVQPGERT